jgi:magnesium-transporting ATPase (P-type)
MGQEGCEVAKDASDVILTNDAFGNVLCFTMWGKNIYLNVRKFLQFQITVNVACTLTILMTACIYGQSPFSTF